MKFHRLFVSFWDEEQSLFVSCRIQQCQLCGMGMLRLSHEFIKILDEEMDRLQDICYMFYVKKEILVKVNCIDQVCDQESMQSKMLTDSLKEKISDLDLGK